jgi:hypothetical protein
MKRGCFSLAGSYWLPWRRVGYLATMKRLKELVGSWSALGNLLRRDPWYDRVNSLNGEEEVPPVPRAKVLRLPSVSRATR